VAPIHTFRLSSSLSSSASSGFRTKILRLKESPLPMRRESRVLPVTLFIYCMSGWPCESRPPHAAGMYLFIYLSIYLSIYPSQSTA